MTTIKIQYVCTHCGKVVYWARATTTEEAERIDDATPRFGACDSRRCHGQRRQLRVGLVGQITPNHHTKETNQ